MQIPQLVVNLRQLFSRGRYLFHTVPNHLKSLEASENVAVCVQDAIRLFAQLLQSGQHVGCFHSRSAIAGVVSTNDQDEQKDISHFI
jgi:hypothetical protein